MRKQAGILSSLLVSILLLVSLNPHSASGMWDIIDRALKEGRELQAFCAKNKSHERCQETRASTLLFWCEGRSPASLGRCHGAITSFLMQAERDTPEIKCIPKAVTDDIEQVRRLFVREGNRKPEVLHLPARNLVLYSVAKAFPCFQRN